MKIDLYTKVIFTIIAVCLALLTVKTFQAVPVVAEREEILKVDLVKVGGYHISKGELLGR